MLLGIWNSLKTLGPIQDLSLDESNDVVDDAFSIVFCDVDEVSRSIRSFLRPDTFKFFCLHISFNSETLSDESDDLFIFVERSENFENFEKFEKFWMRNKNS